MQLSKYHGLGNDFLVLVDLDGRHSGAIDAALARRVCDRHRGIGADGLIRVTTNPTNSTEADVVMELWNADGSRAEMSGNGIRCLAHAVIDSGIDPGPILTVATDAGVKALSRRASDQPGVMRFSVDMGRARVLNIDDDRAEIDMGNPHLVLLDEDGTLDLAGLGAKFPDLNVELVRAEGPGEISMRVWERGVGETEACGTGACAAAVAMEAWGAVSDHVVVHQPGGAAEIDLGDDGNVMLTGPSEFIATVEVGAA